jgi:hypothetical protein
MSSLRQYLKDPFLKSLYQEIRDAGPIRSISLDITSKCNLRCAGCYYFAEGMDQFTVDNAIAGETCLAPNHFTTR